MRSASVSGQDQNSRFLGSAELPAHFRIADELDDPQARAALLLAPEELFSRAPSSDCLEKGAETEEDNY